MSEQELVPIGEHALMVPDVSQQQQMVLMDRMDLEQAMAELTGSVIQQFVYVAKDGKKQPTYAGIKEAARLYRNVHFGATATPLPDGSWMITSYAHNLADNTRCDYPMPYPAFDPRETKQAIEFRASISKSIRNALAAVLPIAYLNTMIARWMEEKSSRPVQPARAGATNGAERTVSAPAPRQPATVTASVPAGAASATSPTAARGAPDAGRGEAAPCEATPAGPDPGAVPAQGSPADWTRTQLASAVRQLAGDELATVQQWAYLARTYFLSEPKRWNDMTPAWLLALYQAMQARALEEQIRLAPEEGALREVSMAALDARERREITAEQYAALDEQADARYAQLAAPQKQAS